MPRPSLFHSGSIHVIHGHLSRQRRCSQTPKSMMYAPHGLSDIVWKRTCRSLIAACVCFSVDSNALLMTVWRLTWEEAHADPLQEPTLWETRSRELTDAEGYEQLLSKPKIAIYIPHTLAVCCVVLCCDWQVWMGIAKKMILILQ